MCWSDIHPDYTIPALFSANQSSLPQPQAETPSSSAKARARANPSPFYDQEMAVLRIGMAAVVSATPPSAARSHSRSLLRRRRSSACAAAPAASAFPFFPRLPSSTGRRATPPVFASAPAVSVEAPAPASAAAGSVPLLLLLLLRLAYYWPFGPLFWWDFVYDASDAVSWPVWVTMLCVQV